MTIQKKRKEIFKDISKNYNEFLRQAEYKLYKHRNLVKDSNAHIELVTDVLYSLIDKFDDETYVNKYFEMLNEDMLFNYICKSIDINTKSYTAPFLRSRITIINRIPYNENLDFIDDEDTYKEEIDNKRSEIAQEIIKSFEPSIAREVYGNEWRYFTRIYKEYIFNPEATYTSIAEKYKIPRGTLARDMIVMKNKILNYLDDEEIL